MRVDEVMIRQVVSVKPGTSLEAAAQEMVRSAVGLLAVFDGGKLVGVITDRDVTVRAVAQGLSPSTTSVLQVMTPKAFSCAADTSLEEASQLMAYNGVRRLLVTDRDACVVGVISIDDLVSGAQVARALERGQAHVPDDGGLSG